MINDTINSNIDEPGNSSEISHFFTTNNYKYCINLKFNFFLDKFFNKILKKKIVNKILEDP